MKTEHPNVKLAINAIAWPEGDQWIAQGIEYDIVAHAADIASLPQAFANAVIENLAITVHLKREPMAGIRAAPEKFRAMFDEAAAVIGLVRPPEMVRDMPVPDINIRVATHA